MGDLILPTSYRQILSPADARKLIVLTFYACGYARMVDLGTKGKFGGALDAEEESDLKRLMQWYANLGQDTKEKIERWVEVYSKGTEDITGKSGRVLDDANRKAMKEITKWESNQ